MGRDSCNDSTPCTQACLFEYQYSRRLLQTKIDTKIDNDQWSQIDDYLEISSVSKDGIPELIQYIGGLLSEK